MIIRIKNLRLRCIIGVNDWERKRKQDVVLNVRLHFQPGNVTLDELGETVDYSALCNRLVAAVESSAFFLLERMAEHLVSILLEDTRVLRAAVEIDKPGALPYADSVSVALERER
ncbi:MAG: dihydroneopterin aldolase, partial [Leptospiraceae bacterium]|nr:dihydroneopterin aldolase [Leptospiraceae bacterium]